MNEEAKKYLECITSPLTKGGVEILEGVDRMGDDQFIVVPKRDDEYGALIGDNGSHAEAIRTMMRAWSGTQTNGDLRVNVLVPNPKRIRTQFV